VAPVLHQEESPAARHDVHAETWKVGVERDVVFGRYLESLDRPLGYLDFRHNCTRSRNVPTLSFPGKTHNLKVVGSNPIPDFCLIGWTGPSSCRRSGTPSLRISPRRR
jgi:hypothetical protein